MKVIEQKEFIKEGAKYGNYYKKSDSMMDSTDELIDVRKSVARQTEIIDSNVSALLDFYKKELVNCAGFPADIWASLFNAIEVLKGGEQCEARDAFEKALSEEEINND